MRHSRHTYRSWLDAVGTPIAVQQKLMRHANIRTTMNVYGDVVTGEMAQAHSKVVLLAVQGVQGDEVSMLIMKLALLSCAFYLGFALTVELAFFAVMLWKDSVGIFFT